MPTKEKQMKRQKNLCALNVLKKKYSLTYSCVGMYLISIRAEQMYDTNGKKATTVMEMRKKAAAN